MRYNYFLILALACAIYFQTGCKKLEMANTSELEKELGNKNKSSLSHTRQYNADVATAWFQLFANLTRSTPYPPPQTARIFAYSGITLYESVVPGMPSYQSIYKYFTGDIIAVDKKKNYHWPTVANAALARIGSKLLLDYSATVNLSAIQKLEASINAQFENQFNASQLQLSKEFGIYVADVIHSWSKSDGTFGPSGAPVPCPYLPLGTPGKWTPTPPGFFAAAGACQGNLRTFIPGVVQATLASPPPAYSTVPGTPFHDAAVEVYQRVLNATPNSLLISQAWRDLLGTNYNTASHLIALTTGIINKENLDLEKAAELFAKQGIASFDAVASAFYSKFHFALLRPITYIRNVMGFTNWNSVYPTPQHPSYPAVAPSAAGASITVLEQAFGPNYAFIDTTQKVLYGTFNYNSFNELLQDVGRSRSHNGLNYQFAVDEGIKQGRSVGKMVTELPFKKL
jgi:hypothetical protein